MAEVKVILLAAGESRRMGVANKLLLEIGGVPLVRRMAERLAAIPDADVTVVLGHEADEIRAVMSGLPVEFTMNDNHATGQMSSVHAGLAAAGKGRCFLIVPADMPQLSTLDCLLLLDAHDEAAEGLVTVPCRGHAGERQRGNPVILPASAARSVLEDGINLGCRGLLDRRPDLLHAFETDRDGFFVDMDTPDAYADVLADAARYLPAGSERRHPEWN